MAEDLRDSWLAEREKRGRRSVKDEVVTAEEHHRRIISRLVEERQALEQQLHQAEQRIETLEAAINNNLGLMQQAGDWMHQAQALLEEERVPIYEDRDGAVFCLYCDLRWVTDHATRKRSFWHQPDCRWLRLRAFLARGGR